MQDDLDRLRERISQLDAELVALLNHRAELALQIGDIKATVGKAVYDPKRERAVLDHIDQLNQGPLDKGAMEEIFACVMTACRELQIRN